MACFSISEYCNLKVVFFVCVFVTLVLNFRLVQNSQIVKYIVRLVNDSQHSNTNGKPHKPLKYSHHPQPTRTLNNQKVMSSCPAYVFPAERLKHETWQTVGPDNSVLVYSAYVDALTPNRLTIIGLSEKNITSNYNCQLWYKDKNWSNKYDMVVSPAWIAMLHDSQLRYTSCAIKCFIPVKSTPFAVSLVSGLRCAQADNVITITHIPKVQDYSKTFTVCLNALHSWYDRAYVLVEWIELNTILGANAFFVYNYSSAANVSAVLQYYQTKGVVDVIQWQLPVGVDEMIRESNDLEVHNYAQTACLNDCLLRSSGASEFIVVLDLDEFIIPHGDNMTSWKDIIDNEPFAGYYIFRNSFFPSQLKKKRLNFPEKELARKFNLLTLLNVKRERLFWDEEERTKYIARTLETSIALTHSTISNRKTKVVEPMLAFLHHYRYWPLNETQDSYVRDKTVINKYSKQLLERVSSTLAELKINR